MMFFTGHCSFSHSLFLHLLLHDLSTLFYGFFFQHFLFTFRALSLFYFLYFVVSSIYYNICHVCLFFLLSSLFSSKFFPSNFHSNSLSVKTPDDIWQIDKFSLFILSSLLLPTSFCHLFFSPTLQLINYIALFFCYY